MNCELNKLIQSKKQILLTVILTVPFFSLFGCSLIKSETEDMAANSQANINAVIQQPTEKEITMHAEEDDQTAFELLTKYTNVNFDESDNGQISIKSINELEVNNSSQWVLYINDQKYLEELEKATLNKGDKVTWKYEPSA